jgi:hypothetical protein
MYLVHLFNLNISFGATMKDQQDVRLMDWIQSTKYEFLVYMFYFICIVVRIVGFPVDSMINTFYYGCLPLATNIFWYLFGSQIYQYLSTPQENCEDETTMFHDKYSTMIPMTLP